MSRIACVGPRLSGRVESWSGSASSACSSSTPGEAFGQVAQHRIGEVAEVTLVLERATRSGAATSRRPRPWDAAIGVALGANVHASSASITASAKPIDEMCPSPMQRSAIATLSSSGARPSCDGCSTALGLQSAAPSTAYSAVNAARARVAGLGQARRIPRRDCRSPWRSRGAGRRHPRASCERSATTRSAVCLREPTAGWRARGRRSG